MRPLSHLLACLTAFFAVAFSLEFTSPSSGSEIDPTQSLVISWSLSYSDPSVIDLKLSNSDSNTDFTLATGVVSYTGSYTVPAGTIQSSGSGYAIVAIGNGNTLGQVTGLSFGGTSDQSSSDTEVTLTSTQIVIPTPATVTSSEETNVTSSNVPTASIDSVGVTTLSGTVSGSQIVASITRSGSSFATSTTSRASSSSNTATATAGSSNTASGQGRLTGEFVLGAAGVLAGIVALLA